MGRTVALNANALVRSTVKTCLMLRLMLQLSWELTVLTCIEMPVLALLQNKYITFSKVSGTSLALESQLTTGTNSCLERTGQATTSQAIVVFTL